MPKLNANLTMLFNEVDFLERFARAARAGFKGVEYLFPYEYPAEQLARLLQEHGLTQVLINFSAGNWAAGERGIAILPERVSEFREGVGQAVEYAKALGCPQINCLAGLAPEGIAPERLRETLVENLRFAAEALEKEEIRLLLEPINTQDMPGFFVHRTRDALALFEEVGHPNLWLQYDIYHMQIMEGNLTRTIRDHIGRISHMQLADNPDRHEPGSGEINYANLLRFIDETGYEGWIGCEYIPAGDTAEGLAWAKAYLS